MADEAPRSETPPRSVEQARAFVEATMASDTAGGTESSCNNNNNNSVETSSITSDGERRNSLEYADELMERGSKAAKEQDYAEATECYSRALEIRVVHYGELSPECVNAYYKYGCALLYKAQDEADPLGTVPKKEDESEQIPKKDGSVKDALNCESSSASVSSNAKEDETSQPHEGAPDDDQEEGEESDDEDLAEADEEESDLDLAWKMLDLARAIVEKHSSDSMEKVDILSALAEVALEREDIETSVSDYLKALAILERLVEPDSRHIAELNFRMCLCLEIGSKAEEALPYCQKAITICNSRVQQLTNELKSTSESTGIPAASELDQTVQQSSNGPQSTDSVGDKEAEIATLTGLSGELEKKLEDLQQLVSNPTSILSDILEMVCAKARGIENNAPPSGTSSSQMGAAGDSGGLDSPSAAGDSGGLDSPSVSTAQTNGAAAGVTNLGVVGRGVKRVVMSSSVAESSPKKKPTFDPTLDNDDGKAS
ncbi:uncharacterized protein LOC131303367 isoform X2 [Rhododendron vialii]|uniref:uncharacterized protein LOC131303367 isoform X2 n=1 Tax=Rhododendron vialii TaxID=182163 RepID=UPI00265F7E76|nr:uncharacterized protein LOC131303367 isoform X2 [Rhododendron vialii]